MNQTDWIPITQLATPHLQNNLAYLKSRGPELFDLLQQGVGGESLLVQQRGNKAVCKAGEPNERWIFGGTDPAQELAAIREMAARVDPNAKTIVLIGNAIGYTFAHLMQSFLQNSKQRLLIVEPTAARIFAALCMLDIRPAINTGRLHFSHGELTVETVLQALREHNLLDAETIELLVSPEIELDWEAEAFHAAYRSARNAWQNEKQAILSSLASRESNEDAKKIERVLLIDCWPGAPGEVHLRTIQQALQKRGVANEWLTLNRYQIEDQGVEYRRAVEPRLLKLLETFPPDLVVSYGYHGHQLAARELFETSGALWLQMVSNICYYDTEFYPSEHTGLIDKHLIPIFEKRGASNAFFVPILADYCLERPTPTSHQAPIVFVGNSLAMSPAEKQGIQQEWRGRPELLRYLNEASDYLGRFEPDTDFYTYQVENPPPQVNGLQEEFRVFRYLLCAASSRKRKSVLERLAPLGLSLFGGDWDHALEPNSPLRGYLRGYLSIHDEPQVFEHGSVFINVQSVGHVTGPNMRFFNVAGMGGFQVSNNLQLSGFLEPDKESVYFETEDECVEKIQYYLAHREKIDEIRTAAQDRIRHDWTYDRWIDWVAEELDVEF